ncbi:MAG: hypothetical protein DRQ10_08025 [Candidatus Hydrothermota bacterium]|nr:MAG: hypothetical protein DRQ10_08025 [Candidatus Hydrothermae bacterium]
MFTLLYVPPVNTDENTARADLKAVAKGVQAMLTQYGFGAKTSSGYGVADSESISWEVKPEKFKEDFKNAWKNGTE